MAVNVRLAVLTLLVIGCSKQEPEPTPTPAGEAVEITEELRAQIEAQTGIPVTSMSVRFEDPPEDVFVNMVVAAGGWAKGTARLIGVYQSPSASPRFRRAVEAVTNRYAFRPIGPSDFAVVCGGNAPSRTSITARTPKCSMKYVDAVLAFNSVMMGRDTGFVGLNITRVPTGTTKAERVYYCISLLRKGEDAWEAKRSERIVNAARCPRNIP